MNIPDAIKQELEKRGCRNLKDASKLLGISPELLRVTLSKGHLPKDKTLLRIADKLGLDGAAMVLAAHREKVPTEVKGFFLAPATRISEGRRISPLSSEQCEYLARLMSTEEIQLVRKYRQITGEAKTQVIGYIEYMFATRRRK